MTDTSESTLTVHDGGGEADIFDPAGHRPSNRRLVAGSVIALAVITGLLAASIVPRVLHRSALEADELRSATAIPNIRVARAERVSASAALSLPGTVEPLQETRVYARANGYVRRWLVDIGAEVKKGQVMVELDIPDVDEQVRAAEAAANQTSAGVAQAESQLHLAKTTSARYTTLAPSGVVSQQEVEQYQSSFEVQEANVAAAEAAHRSAQANVRRASDLKSFGTIVAPFDGVVTMRAAEVGQLVAAGTGAGQPLYKVAEVDTVRVFVNVPQLYAAGITVGMAAPTTMRETPGRVFPGKVARTAHELDTATRSLLTEVDIPNADGTLVAGMYAQVSFDVKRQDQPIFVPATAVVFDTAGTRLAVVNGGVVHWRKVEVGGDFGDRLAISTGLVEGDMVAATPSERLVEGMTVRIDDAQARKG